MAISRNARRKLARERKKAKAYRLYKREQALKANAVAEIVERNRRTPPERNYYKGTTSTVFSGAAQPAASQKHCEAKQKVTVYGRDAMLTGRQASKRVKV